ncbi:MAG: hypothetical protein HOV80_29945 [Polyangiaceae bacterium]|nr:hypothetical protein [Polyangiaceae bacterium]
MLELLESFPADCERAKRALKELVPPNNIDEWGAELQIECLENDWRVRSAGADGTFQSPDDIEFLKSEHGRAVYR